MPATTNPRSVPATWARQLLGAAIYQILNIYVAASHLTLLILLIVGIVLVPIFFVGAPLVALCLVLAPVIANAERTRQQAFLGSYLKPPNTLPATGPWWRQLFFNRQSWRTCGYIATHTFWGLPAGCLIGFSAFYALKILLACHQAIFVTKEHVITFFLITTTKEVPAFTAAAVSIGLLLVAAGGAWVFSRVDLWLARAFIGADKAEQISALATQVTTLTQTRAETVSSVEAERRRIERDLHDGPQQRLVSIAMDLSLAKAHLADNPEASQSLIDQAHQASKEAITEMRQVARGIAPPILTDRGLAAALSALAAKSSVSTTVSVDLAGRLHPDVESVTYFCVSEALTNVVKHAQADQVLVTIGQRAEPTAVVVATVTDDGCGGADPSKGTGITGLRQRLAAVDGTLTVDSPPGGPTTITATLPDLPRPPTPTDNLPTSGA